MKGGEGRNYLDNLVGRVFQAVETDSAKALRQEGAWSVPELSTPQGVKEHTGSGKIWEPLLRLQLNSE